MKALIFGLALLWASPVLGEEITPSESGEARVPLSEYTRMLENLRQEQRPAPAAYAVGSAEVAVQVREQDERTAAGVRGVSEARSSANAERALHGPPGDIVNPARTGCASRRRPRAASAAPCGAGSCRARGCPQNQNARDVRQKFCQTPYRSTVH